MSETVVMEDRQPGTDIELAGITADTYTHVMGDGREVNYERMLV